MRPRGDAKRASACHNRVARVRRRPFVALTAPLFVLIALGFAIARSGRWPPPSTDALTRFVFAVAVPALLFRLMSDFSTLPPIDPRVLRGVLRRVPRRVRRWARVASRALFAPRWRRAVGVRRSARVFSNTVLLGVPLVQITLGAAGDARGLADRRVQCAASCGRWCRCRSNGRGTARSALPRSRDRAQGAAEPDRRVDPRRHRVRLLGLALPGVRRPATRRCSRRRRFRCRWSRWAWASARSRSARLAESVAIAALKLAVMPAVAFALARAGRACRTTRRRRRRDGGAADRRERLPDGASFRALEGPVAASLVVSTARRGRDDAARARAARAPVREVAAVVTSRPMRTPRIVVLARARRRARRARPAPQPGTECGPPPDGAICGDGPWLDFAR